MQSTTSTESRLAKKLASKALGHPGFGRIIQRAVLWASRVPQKKDRLEVDDLTEILRVWDTESNGLVTVSALQNVMDIVGDPLTEAEVLELTRRSSGETALDAMVDYEGFIAARQATRGH